MSPELEAALEPIGWPRVKEIAPRFARIMASDLTPTGGRLAAAGKGSSRDAHDHLLRTMRGMQGVWEDLRALPEQQRATINIASCPVDDRDAGVPDRVARAISALEDIVLGLRLLEDLLNWEASNPGDLNDKPHYQVALAIGRIYVVGMGQLPGYGSRAEGSNKEATPFARAVRSAFDALGIRQQVRRPCEHARDQIQEHELQELLALKSGSEFDRRGLFRPYVQKMSESGTS